MIAGSPTAAVLLAAALVIAACGTDPPPETPPAPPPTPVAPVPAPLPIAPIPVPPPLPDYDPSSATATILVRAGTKGTLPRMRPINFDACPQCGAEQVGVVLNETVVAIDEKLANVIVWISSGADRWSYPPPAGEALIELKRCIFVPHVLTLRVGQPLRISNPVHPMLHLHVVPKINGEIARGIPARESHVAAFPSEEVGVKVKCDVHNWMGARVGVFSHPFHGVTGADGSVSIRVPPGRYEVSAWHEYEKWTVKPEPRTVSVAEGETTGIEFIFEIR